MHRLAFTAFALFLAPAAAAQVTPIPWFPGDHSETFDNHTLGVFLPCINASTNAEICATDMHVTTGWGFNCTIFPQGGSAFAGNTGGFQTWTFTVPVVQWGGYLATNCGAGNQVTLRFYDLGGNLIDTVVEPLGNCLWDWRGYAYASGISTIEIENSAYAGGFVMVDEVEMSEAVIPDFDGDGYETADGDCNDFDDTIYPGAPEICDGLDNNCDGALGVSEGDADGDGSVACEDCDDNNPNAYPGNNERCDGVDNNCDGTIDPFELDDDGDGLPECQNQDCDDANAARFPGNPEICDGIDNDCDDVLDPDEIDNDGDGAAVCDGDCDDDNINVYPAAEEIADDGVDQDCDGEDLVSGGTATGGGTGTGTGGATTDPKVGGCGCATTGSSGAAALLPLMLLALRRRR